MDKLFIFVFISVTLLVPYLVLSALVAGEQIIATCFSVKKKCLGHNLPPFHHGFGVTLACTSFPVPVGTIFVVLMILKLA